VITRNLNKIIDLNYYPVKEAEYSNLKNRPIGIGIQGLADVYQILEMSFESEEAAFLNEKIFETIYYAAVSESI
jgi:ribonucleoside-diphosphate reductase alpha chain